MDLLSGSNKVNTTFKVPKRMNRQVAEELRKKLVAIKGGLGKYLALAGSLFRLFFEEF